MGDKQAQLERDLADAVRQRREGLQQEEEAIAAALKGGMKQADVIKMTGYSREKVRYVARRHGVAPAR